MPMTGFDLILAILALLMTIVTLIQIVKDRLDAQESEYQDSRRRRDNKR